MNETTLGQEPTIAADAGPHGTFVAREGELARLDAWLDQALAGQGQIGFVAGGAGSGKTALIAEFARRAQDTAGELVVAVGNCNAQSGIGDPYLPFREILGLLAGDVETKLEEQAVSGKNANRLRRLAVRTGQVLIEVAPEVGGCSFLGRRSRPRRGRSWPRRWAGRRSSRRWWRRRERWWEADVHRSRGRLLLMQRGGDEKILAQAESSLQEAIATARRQQARSWELRATLDLCRLWQGQGRVDEARRALVELYDWFDEGLETPDLIEAARLLEDLTP